MDGWLPHDMPHSGLIHCLFPDGILQIVALIQYQINTGQYYRYHFTNESSLCIEDEMKYHQYAKSEQTLMKSLWFLLSPKHNWHKKQTFQLCACF